MPRRKIEMRLIENARARAATYAKRTKGLQKKAEELSMLCAVPVALVCAPAGGAGAGARLVWESEEGVLDRYRRGAAIPHDTRATHTHRSYLEAELSKERAKLARARPGALPDWDPALNDMTPEEAQQVLETIDAALRAARDRMAALGLSLPTHGGLGIEQVAAASDADASGVVARHLGLEADMDMGAGLQMQMMPWNGGDGGLLEQFQMQPGYGLECVGGGSSYDETQAPGGYGGNNAGCGWPDLSMCYATADETWVPAGYYPEFTDGVAAPKHYSAQDVTGGDYVGTLPLQYPKGMDENLTYLDMDNSYAAHWQAEEFQRSHTGAGQYQYYQSSDPGTCSSSNQAFHYH